MTPLKIIEPRARHAIGIDLGTTNSLAAVARGGEVEILSGADGNALLPSVVHYGARGKITIGRAAMEKPDAIRSIKRLMGRGRDDAKKIAGTFPYPLSEEDGALRLKIGKKSVTPVEISAEILKALKANAEKALGAPVAQAVITVPAYFDDAARAATKDAARLAGLSVLRLLNEPTAAALAYGLDRGAEGIYAVYDLGGGTFDVSLLKMRKGVFQVLATGGDTALGGDDFDQAVAQYFIAQIGAEPERNESAGLFSAARAAKEYLTGNDSGEWEITLSGHKKKVSLDIKTLNDLIGKYVDRTIDIFRAVLFDAQVELADIKGIVLVGGATRMRLVRGKLAEFAKRAPLTDVDPDRVVAAGAAIQAEALTRGSANLLLDVTPLSLGLETMGGLAEVLIPRNTPVPAAKSQKFTTFKDGQTGLKIHVVQGERELVDQCRSLARFELTGIPPLSAGAAIVEVTFLLDADGLLTVSAREETTGAEQRVQVKPSYGLPPEEVERMLRDSMEHAREDITARLLAEARVEAEQALAGVEDALRKDGDLLSRNDEEIIRRQIALVRELAEGTDRDAIDYEVRQLDKICGEFAEARVNRALGGLLRGASVEEVGKRLG